jgi:uncharacterized protein YhfF
MAFTASLLLLSPSLLAFYPKHHDSITRDVLKDVTRTIEGHTLRFSRAAIDEIVAANMNQDDGFFPSCPISPPRTPFADSRNHFDGERLADAASLMRDRLNEAREKLKVPSPNGPEARKLLGQVLHAAQDYYAHSNWVERGHNGKPDERLGKVSFGPVALSEATCLAPPNAGTYVSGAGPTSGYFFGCDGKDDSQLPAGKCYHGVEKPFFTFAGTNKDHENRPFFTEAHARAKESTKSIIDDLLNSPGIKDNLKATAALMGARTLAFVIDDTESMSDELALVKASVQSVVNAATAAGETPEYLLVRFKDYDEISEPFVTTNAAEFVAHVNALIPEFGSQCPEFAFTATHKAVNASLPGSRVHVYSDAGPWDWYMASATLAAAKERDVEVLPILTGTCSPIDPEFKRIAKETGGQLFFVEPSELLALTSLITPQVSGDFESLLIAHGVLSGPPALFGVLVDPSVRHVLFSVSGEPDAAPAVVLTRPNGTIVAAGDPGVTMQSLSTGTLVAIEAPAVGSWTLSVNGTSEYSVVVKGNTSLSIDAFRFVEHVDSVHPGFFDIDGQPLAGQPATALARVGGMTGSVTFDAVTLEGNPLAPLPLATGHPDAADGDYTGTFDLPNAAFRVRVRGLEDGYAFQRVLPKVFRGQSVRVTVDPTTIPESLPSDSQATIRFSVFNDGPAAVFNVVAQDDLPDLTYVPISWTFSLPTGAVRDLDVLVRVPPDTPRRSTHLTVSASVDGESDLGNSASVDFVVGTPPPALVTITDFSPQSGSLGMQVTINGTAFGPTSSDNVVTINGAPATVASATSTQLVVTVPTGATSGPLTVLSPSGSATSDLPFVVEMLAPTVIGFTPTIGLPGSSVTVMGSAFEPTAGQNTFILNATPGQVTAASTTALTVTVPTGVTSGRLTVMTASGTAVSTEDFIVPPSPYGVDDVATAARIAAGTASIVSVSTTGKIGLRLFDGVTGGRVSVLGTDGVTGQVLGCDVLVSMLNPVGGSVAAPTCMEQSGFIDTKTLSSPGTYTIVVDPAGPATGTVTLTRYEVPADISGTIAPGGLPVTASMLTPGQNGSLTFVGTAGQRISLLGTEGMSGQMSFTCDVNVSILNPDGTVLLPSTCMEGSGFIDTMPLPSSGTYKILIDPTSYATGSVTLTLYDVPADFSSTITPGSSVTATMATRGQNGSLTFSGIVGQRVALLGVGMLGQVSLACDVNVSILSPDGSTFAPATCVESSGFIGPNTLPGTGTYTIVVDPMKWAIGDVTLTLYVVPPDSQDAIEIGAPPQVVSLGSGQNGTLTFSGNAAQQVTVRMTSNTIGTVTVRLLKPDGSQLTAATSAGANFNLALQALPTSGTYTIVVDPGGANAGSINIAVTNP